MEPPKMLAEHLEGADECTVESLLNCVQDYMGSSKKHTDDLEVHNYGRSCSRSYSCAAMTPVMKPVEKPAHNGNMNSSSSGVIVFVSPPQVTNVLEVVFKSTVDSSPCSVHASLGSPLKSCKQREATDECSAESGHTDAGDKGTADLTSSGVYVSKRALRKQTLCPKPDEDFWLTDADDKGTVDLTSSGAHAAKCSLREQPLRPKPGAVSTDCAPSSPKASLMHKPEKKMPCRRPQKCNVCHKVVSNNEVLKMHMRTHTGEKPYSCPMCPATFATAFCLRIHKRTHTGEKPYPCKVCGRKFSQLCNRRQHMLIHTGERPHLCNICGDTFALRLTLRRHLRIHLGE